jgi:hypothetical protein
MVSPSLLWVIEIPVSVESCCTSWSRWSWTVPPSFTGRPGMRELPIQLRNLLGQRVDLRHCLRHLGIGVGLRAGEAVRRVVERVRQVLAGGEHALLRGRAGRGWRRAARLLENAASALAMSPPESEISNSGPAEEWWIACPHCSAPRSAGGSAYSAARRARSAVPSSETPPPLT